MHASLSLYTVIVPGKKKVLIFKSLHILRMCNKNFTHSSVAIISASAVDLAVKDCRLDD